MDGDRLSSDSATEDVSSNDEFEETQQHHEDNLSENTSRGSNENVVLISHNPAGFLKITSRTEVLFILGLCFLIAVILGGVIGIVPAEMADRYARLYHHFDGPACYTFEIKPNQCQEGTDDAQAALSWSLVGLCIFSLLLNPTVGKLSDQGRRPVMMLCIVLNCVPTLVFLITLLCRNMNPAWYYFSGSVAGGFQYIGLLWASLSDVVPSEHRAGIFGLLIGMLYGGFAVAPSIPLFLGHTQTAFVCAGLAIASVFITILFFPETLSNEVEPTVNSQERGGTEHQSNHEKNAVSLCLQPYRQFSILNSNCSIRLIAAGAFISSMVLGSDYALLLYYVEDHLAFGDKDVAFMFLLAGIVGFLFQTVALTPLVKCIGEHHLLILTFACGSVHNLLYGMAKSKTTIFVGVVFSQFTKVNIPLLATFASKSVGPRQQGQIQGVMSALNSIGTACGPVSLEIVYSKTKKLIGLGPGFIFVYAAGLYLFGTAMVSFIPQSLNDEPQEGRELELDDGASLVIDQSLPAINALPSKAENDEDRHLQKRGLLVGKRPG